VVTEALSYLQISRLIADIEANKVCSGQTEIALKTLPNSPSFCFSTSAKEAKRLKTINKKMPSRGAAALECSSPFGFVFICK
jgi:hypothetical protein